MHQTEAYIKQSNELAAFKMAIQLGVITLCAFDKATPEDGVLVRKALKACAEAARRISIGFGSGSRMIFLNRLQASRYSLRSLKATVALCLDSSIITATSYIEICEASRQIDGMLVNLKLDVRKQDADLDEIKIRFYDFGYHLSTDLAARATRKAARQALREAKICQN